MNIKSLLLTTTLGAILSMGANASGDVKHYADPLRKIFIENPRQLPDYAYQNQLRKKSYWTQFISESGNWTAMFNESNGLPRLAIGKPISVAGSSAKAVADNFLNNNLSNFNIPISALEYHSEATSSKYRYVNYKQQYQGIELLFSKVQVKMTLDFRVMQFGLGCHPNININTQPALSESAAVQFASTGVAGITGISVNPDIKILPIPVFRNYNYRLVYEVTVSNLDAQGIPGKYYTLIDANNGEVLYRTNQIHHVAANTDVNVTGTLHLTHPYDPSTVEPLKNMKVVEGGTTYFTDNTGFLGLTNTAATTATMSLEGQWVRVRTNNVTPSWTVNLNPGANAVNIDGNTDIKQRTTFNAIVTVHDYMKTKYPAFTGLDFALTANVDVAGSCNAFYDGNSVNFFAAGGGCNATSLVVDVCYHEYGHGINDKFYQSIGAVFQNGAMGEGYADLWALGITTSPILGIGFFDNDPNGFVRRYDIDKKVYPQDLVGEVHADGEIIAGAFWDTHLNLGNLQQMMDLFKETFYAGISDADGTEGTLFPQILTETLTVDDNDGDITNGTPNYCAITSGFAIHGITTSALSGINHTEVLQSAPLAPVTINAVVQSLGAGSTVQGNYRTSNTGPYTQFSLINTGGSNYEGTIPAQPNGTIIEYYLGLEDNCGTFLNVIPGGAADANPNIPYYILVGFNELVYEDFDSNFGVWQTGIPSDDATTGIWTIDLLIPSFVGTGLVQPDVQVTPGGLFCAFTGNAANASSGAGDNDVDGGKTTLISSVQDLTGYTNPAITYHRWYTNDQGATPGTDFWQVAISGDGTTWIPVENTNVADHSWRRFAFKVLDYITPSSTVYLRFIAEDANAGSLIEAALDDFKVWDEIPTGTSETESLAAVHIYPNPASNSINLNVGMVRNAAVQISILNNLGQIVHSYNNELPAGNNIITIDALQFAAGIYQVQVVTGDSMKTEKISIVR